MKGGRVGIARIVVDRASDTKGRTWSRVELVGFLCMVIKLCKIEQGNLKRYQKEFVTKPFGNNMPQAQVQAGRGQERGQPNMFEVAPATYGPTSFQLYPRPILSPSGIQKLNGDNYLAWKRQISVVFKLARSEGRRAQSRVPPEPTTKARAENGGRGSENSLLLEKSASHE